MEKQKKKYHGKDTTGLVLLALFVIVALVVVIVVFHNINAGKKLDVPPDRQPDSSSQQGSDAQDSSGQQEIPSSGQKSDAQESSGQEPASDGQDKPSDGQDKPTPSPTPGPDEEKDPSVFWKNIPVTEIPADPFLILVNHERALPEDYQSKLELTSVQGYKMQVTAAENLRRLIADAAEDGIKIVLCSGFRTHNRQIELYTGRIKTVQKQNPNLTWEEACRKAATINTLPGTSEHETGLCWDFADLNYSFDTTKEYRWLISHCTDYGFVCRYPKEKRDITGIIYEPWHYRYVVVEAAKEMEKLGMCLEEYTEYLAKKG